MMFRKNIIRKIDQNIKWISKCVSNDLEFLAAGVVGHLKINLQFKFNFNLICFDYSFW